MPPTLRCCGRLRVLFLLCVRAVYGFDVGVFVELACCATLLTVSWAGRFLVLAACIISCGCAMGFAPSLDCMSC